MDAEECIRAFSYEWDFFLTHIANTLMKDKRLDSSEAVSRTLEGILTAIQRLHDIVRRKISHQA